VAQDNLVPLDLQVRLPLPVPAVISLPAPFSDFFPPQAAVLPLYTQHCSFLI